NRIDPACGHIVHYLDHARIVDFRGVDIGKHWIWHSPGSYDEIHQSRIRIARIELHTDGAPAEVEPLHRCDNTFGGGFIRRNIGAQTDRAQRADWLGPTRYFACRAESV